MQKSQKKPAWRIVAFILGVVMIAVMWVCKDVPGQFAGVSLGEALPMMAVSLAVTLLKVGLMAGVVLLIKWFAGRFKK